MVTFGGAYALLAWLSQEAVNVQGWVTATEMLDGLGLAETTPGPTVLVTQFVGFLAAFRSPEPFGPLIAGVLGALLTVWVTFAPSFLWIFVGAPYIEDLRSNRRLSAALSGITAAVVGTIAYLAIWFALNVLFGSVEERQFWVVRYFAIDLMSLDWRMATLSAIAFTLVFKIKASLAVTVGGLATLGIVITQLVPTL